MTGNKYKKAFTVSELLVVMAMIGILSLVIIPSYKNAKEQLALERSAVQLAQYISKAREMAISTQEWGGQAPQGGYGIYIRLNPPVQRSYILFADRDDNQRYNSVQDDIVETVFLESGVRISNLTRNIVSMGFKAPDPMVYFWGKTYDPDGWSESGFSQLVITISLDSNPAKLKTITVNKVGLIDIN